MAIIIIKKHRNGSIFGEYRPAVLEFTPWRSLFRALYPTLTPLTAPRGLVRKVPVTFSPLT